MIGGLNVGVTTVGLKALEDDRGNRIVYDGPGLPGVSITFRGSGNMVEIDDEAFVNKLNLDFNGSNGSFVLGANRLKRSFSASVRIGEDSRVEIGEGVSATSGVVISAVEGTRIRIGRDVMFASQNQVRGDDGHPIFDVRTGKRVNPAEDIVIGDHVWLAWGATLLGGAVVGDGSVIGAFSVVTGRIPNNCIAVGTPARVVRRDIAWERPHLGLNPPFYKPDRSSIPITEEFWNLTTDW